MNTPPWLRLLIPVDNVETDLEDCLVSIQTQHQTGIKIFSRSSIPLVGIDPAMTLYFRMRCTVCNAGFSSGTSAKSARSCRDRHLREVHGRGALRWRRERNAKQQSAYRRAKRSARSARAALLRALVLCPL